MGPAHLFLLLDLLLLQVPVVEVDAKPIRVVDEVFFHERTGFEAFAVGHETLPPQLFLSLRELAEFLLALGALVFVPCVVIRADNVTTQEKTGQTTRAILS